MRWSSCARARGASPTRARRPQSFLTDWLPQARTAGRRSASILLAINDRLSPFLVAGFYYKTFMWPARFWEAVYEPLIRRAAGLGRAAGAEDPDHYEKAYAHCDVLVIGGGPAGLVGGARGRPRRRAGDPRRGGFSPWRAAARGAPRGRRQVRRRLGRRGRGGTRLAARCADHAAHDGHQRVRSRAIQRGRARERSCGGAAGVRAAPARLEDRGEACGARVRRASSA